MLTSKEKANMIIETEEKPLHFAINSRSKCVQDNDSKMFQYWSNVIKEVETLLKKG